MTYLAHYRASAIRLHPIDDVVSRSESVKVEGNAIVETAGALTREQVAAIQRQCFLHADKQAGDAIRMTTADDVTICNLMPLAE